MKSKWILLTALAVAIAVAAMAPALTAVAQDSVSSDDISMYDTSGHDTVFMAISAGSAQGGNVTFTVPYAAKITGDQATVYNFSRPLNGMINVSRGIGMISKANMLPYMTTVNLANRSSIPAAGVSAIVALQGGKKTNLTAAGAGARVSEYNRVSIMLGNGSVETILLDKPIRVVKSEDRKLAIIDAYPAFTRYMAGWLQGPRFSASATAVPLTKILGAPVKKPGSATLKPTSRPVSPTPRKSTVMPIATKRPVSPTPVKATVTPRPTVMPTAKPTIAPTAMPLPTATPVP